MFSPFLSLFSFFLQRLIKSISNGHTEMSHGMRVMVGLNMALLIVSALCLLGSTHARTDYAGGKWLATTLIILFFFSY